MVTDGSNTKLVDRIATADQTRRCSILLELQKQADEDPAAAVQFLDALPVELGRELLWADHQLVQNSSWKLLRIGATKSPAVALDWSDDLKHALTVENESVLHEAIPALAAVTRSHPKRLDMPGELATSLRTHYKGQKMDVSRRQDTATILGVILHPSAVQALAASLEYEVETVVMAAEKSLERLRDRAICTLGDENASGQLEAAKALKELEEQIPDTVAERAKLLPGLLECQDGDATDAVARVIESVLETDRETLSTLVPRLVTKLGSNSSHAPAEQILERAISLYPDLSSALIALQARRRDSIREIPGEISEERPRIRQLIACTDDDSVAPTARAAIREISRRSAGSRWTALSELRRHIKSDRDDRLLELLTRILQDSRRSPPDDLSQELTELLVSRGDEAQARQGLVALADCGTPGSAAVAAAVSRLILADGQGAGWASKVYLQCAKRSPSDVMYREDAVLALLQSADLKERVRGLKVVKWLAKSKTDSDLRKPLRWAVDQLEEDNAEEVLVVACEALGASGIYPVPEPLKQCRSDDRSKAVQEAAESAVKRLRKAHETPTPAELTTRGLDDLTTLESSKLRYRRGSLEFTKPNLSSLDQQLIREVVARYEAGQNGILTLPYYEPKAITAITVELLCREMDNDATIVLFSPIFRNRWGTKTDVKQEYRRYYVARPDVDKPQATPLPWIMAPDSGRRKGTGETELRIVKRISELRSVSDSDAVLLNFTSKMKPEYKEILDELIGETIEAPTFALFSAYTGFQDEWYTDYEPPGPNEFATHPIHPDVRDDQEANPVVEADTIRGATDFEAALDAVAAAVSDIEDPDETPFDRARSAIRRLEQGSVIRVEPCQDDRILDLLWKIYEREHKLADGPLANLGNEIFYTQMLFERLPVPAKEYDRWIEAERMEGNFRVPQKTKEEIDDLESYGSMIDEAGSTTAAKGIVRVFDQLRDELLDRNPLFDRIVTAVEYAQDSDISIAVFGHKATWVQMLRDSLARRHGLDDDALSAADVTIVGPRAARQLNDIDLFIIPGPLRPNANNYYLHPEAKVTAVLSYGTRWTSSVEQISSDAAEDLGLVAAGQGDRFAVPTVVEPDIDTEMPVEEAADEDFPDQSEPSVKERRTAEQRMAERNRERIVRAFEEARSRERGGRTGRNREYRRYRVETEDSTIQLSSEDRVLRERRSSAADADRNPYHWVTPTTLSPSDTILYIEPDTRRRLWVAHLEETWSEEVEDVQKITDAHATWFDTAAEIIEKVESDTPFDPSDLDLYKKIQARLSSEIDEFDRKLGTVRDWFESVHEADEPLELVEDPTLRIGPGSKDDIRYVGVAFDKARLVDEYERIDWALGEFRRINRQEGQSFQQSLADRISDEGVEAIDGIEEMMIKEVIEMDTSEDVSESDSAQDS